MPTAGLHRSKMTVKNPNTCKAIISNSGIDPPIPQLSYVRSFTIREPNIRIRIPKLLAKTIQRRRSTRCSKENGEHHTIAKKEGTVKTKKGFFSSVFGKMKTSKTHSKVHKNDNDGCGSGSDNVGDGDQARTSLPDCYAFKKLLEIGEEEEEEHERPGMEEKKPSWAAELYLKVSFPFLSLFNKYAKMNFFGGKVGSSNGWNQSRSNSIADSSSRTDIAKSTDQTVNRTQGTTHDLPAGDGKGDIATGEQKRGSNLTGYLSRVLDTRQELSATKQIGGNSEQAGEGRREECGEELCKKRILMGDKCKPLNVSGLLQYDEDGILLPEVLLW